MSDRCVTEAGASRHIKDPTREGRSLCGRRARWSAVRAHDHYEMCGQCELLKRLASSELATPKGDVLAEHDAGEGEP
ncbi:hypothetical protein ACIBCT_20725 [Streptosporangium sp. NPDC050855]|uniref:hypothetical protein n=1 Tax=Streptosporangium sp. NPDC050855 TaxID=3366194 RepID=UPI00379594FB